MRAQIARKMVAENTDSPVRLRRMTRRDVAAMVRVIGGHDVSDGRCARRYFREYFSDPTRVKSRREQNFVAVGTDKGEVIGVCGFSPDKCGTPNVLWLNWFYVDKRRGRKGVGRQLLSHTFSLVRSIPRVDKLYLDTSSHPRYSRAVRVYKRCGFRVEGDLTDYYGEGEDCIIMGLDLRARCS